MRQRDTGEERPRSVEQEKAAEDRIERRSADENPGGVSARALSETLKPPGGRRRLNNSPADGQATGEQGEGERFVLAPRARGRACSFANEQSIFSPFTPRDTDVSIHSSTKRR